MNNIGGIKEKLRKEIKDLEATIEAKKKELLNAPSPEIEELKGKYLKSKDGILTKYIYIKDIKSYSPEKNELHFHGFILSICNMMMGSNYFFDLQGGGIILDYYEETTEEFFKKNCELAINSIKRKLESINESRL